MINYLDKVIHSMWRKVNKESGYWNNIYSYQILKSNILNNLVESKFNIINEVYDKKLS